MTDEYKTMLPITTQKLFPVDKLEDIFLTKANMYSQNHPLYNYLISRDIGTRQEQQGLMETAYFLRGGMDDRY